MQKTNKENKTSTITEKTIGDKKYIVKSVFIGDKDIKTALLALAEKKAAREMGLDIAT
jgi:hypothetical protein